jgi:hypothetical protein
MAKTKKAKRTMSKTAFVLGLPDSMSRAEVVERAKKQGIDLSVAYISSIRTAARVKAKAARPTSPAAQPSGPAVPTARGAEATDRDREFMTMALDLGLSRAADLLERVRTAVLASGA